MYTQSFSLGDYFKYQRLEKIQSSAVTGQIAMVCSHNEVPCVSKGTKAFLNTLLWCELQDMLL